MGLVRGRRNKNSRDLLKILSNKTNFFFIYVQTNYRFMNKCQEKSGSSLTNIRECDIHEFNYRSKVENKYFDNNKKSVSY